ncbi:MAG: prenyltransferase/squalene oxidase repeat-containing protein, partial [bacterium]
MNEAAVNETLTNAQRYLLKQYNLNGYWSGGLSSSALATATAVFALAQADAHAHRETINHGLNWLVATINQDGGWGDSPESPSNLSTTLICRAALTVGDLRNPEYSQARRLVEVWLSGHLGDLEPATIIRAVYELYGDDHSFSAPILAMLALAGQLGPADTPWESIAQLPFELAVFPHTLMSILRLNVVSYALPALVALGVLRHRRAPGGQPLRLFRDMVTKAALRRIRVMQPSDGGYHAAPPLTAFVVMFLCAAGEKKSELVRDGVDFLRKNLRPDGGAPISMNLSVWMTALATATLLETKTENVPVKPVRNWLLRRQYMHRHPMTDTPPGGWGWTHLPGSIPDGDDTSAVLVALRKLESDPMTRVAAERGINWLLQLQNADGGFPTFCRGWGKLPFDRSCPDITGKALSALAAWWGDVPASMQRRMRTAINRALTYLTRAQQADGQWIPLWFGNQDAPDMQNPVFGTALVTHGISQLDQRTFPEVAGLLARGRAYLLATQNSDGGWGARHGMDSAIEETGMAICALAGWEPATAAIGHGADWLVEHTSHGTAFCAMPIGLYFESL